MTQANYRTEIQALKMAQKRESCTCARNCFALCNIYIWYYIIDILKLLLTYKCLVFIRNLRTAWSADYLILTSWWLVSGNIIHFRHSAWLRTDSWPRLFAKNHLRLSMSPPILENVNLSHSSKLTFLCPTLIVHGHRDTVALIQKSFEQTV